MPLPALEIEHQAPLAAIKQSEERALAVMARRIGAHLLAAWPLDLDYLGARLGEHQGGERPRQQGREVEHDQARQRLGHGTPPGSRRAVARPARERDEHVEKESTE